MATSAKTSFFNAIIKTLFHLHVPYTIHVPSNYFKLFEASRDIIFINVGFGEIQVN